MSLNKKSLLLKISVSLSIIWLCMFTVAPFLLLLIQSILDKDMTINFNSYIEFFNANYLKVTFQTIYYAAIITALSLFMSIYTAFFISKVKHGNLLISLILVPAYLNLLLKTYAFIAILGENGLINTILDPTGIHFQWLFTTKGFLIVTVYIFFPIMVSPIYYSIKKINKNIINAAYDLGANDNEVLFKVIIPSMKESIFSAIQLVFIPALSLFMVARIIAGQKIMTLGMLIEQHFLVTSNWQMGAVISIFLICIAVISMAIFKVILRVGD